MKEKARGDFDKKYTLSATAPTEATYVSYYVQLSCWDEGADKWHVMDEERFFLTTYVPWKRLEGDQIMILFQVETPKTEQVDHALALLPYLDQAYELLGDWTGNTPYHGLKIGIVYNSSIVDEFAHQPTRTHTTPLLQASDIEQNKRNQRSSSTLMRSLKCAASPRAGLWD